MKMDGSDAKRLLSGLEEAQRSFSEAGLPLPPIPKRFESELRARSVWGWLEKRLDDKDDARTWAMGHGVRGADAGAGSVPDHELPTNAARQWLDGQSFTEPPHYHPYE